MLEPRHHPRDRFTTAITCVWILSMVVLTLLLVAASVSATEPCQIESGEAGGSGSCAKAQSGASQPAALGLPIFLTSMIHLEGDTLDDTNREVFQQTLAHLDDAMTLAEAYGAIQTIESERPFAIGSIKWAPGSLRNVLLRGHGVGTHCDVGYATASSSFHEYVFTLRGNKQLVDDLVGASNNTGCSGAGSELDWVVGLASAGFEYVNGIVGMHYLATLPMSRPPGYFDGEIRTGGLHHSQVPVDLIDRVYLRTLKNAHDMEHDDDGILVLSPGSFGKLAGIYEGAYLSEAGLPPVSTSLELNDVDALVDLVEWIDRHRDRSRVAKITIMSHARDWNQNNKREAGIMEYFLSSMEILADAGTIQWASEKTVADTYLDIMHAASSTP